MSTAITSAIEFDDHGRPWVAGTQTKVIEVVLDHIAYGFSPVEIHFQHPDLSLAGIHSALAYYYSHQTELDAEIQRQLRNSKSLAEQSRDSPGRRRLRNNGLLP